MHEVCISAPHGKTIAGVAALVYGLAGMRREEVGRFRSKIGDTYSG